MRCWCIRSLCPSRACFLIHSNRRYMRFLLYTACLGCFGARLKFVIVQGMVARLPTAAQKPDFSSSLFVSQQSQKQEQRQMSLVPYETSCWGCGVRLILPSIVPVYKCGWCGAISNNDTQTRKEGWWLKCSYALDRILVAIITFLVLLIICQ